MAMMIIRLVYLNIDIQTAVEYKRCPANKLTWEFLFIPQHELHYAKYVNKYDKYST